MVVAVLFWVKVFPIRIMENTMGLVSLTFLRGKTIPWVMVMVVVRNVGTLYCRIPKGALIVLNLFRSKEILKKESGGLFRIMRKNIRKMRKRQCDSFKNQTNRKS